MRFLNQLILSSFTTLSFSIVATDLVLTSNIDNKNFSSSVKENKIEAFGAKVIQAQQTVDEIKREIEIVDLNLKKDNKNLEDKTNSQKNLEENIKQIEEKIKKLELEISKKTETIAKLEKKHKEIKDKKAKMILKEYKKRKNLLEKILSLESKIFIFNKKTENVKTQKVKEKIELFLKFQKFKQQLNNANNEVENRIFTKHKLKKNIQQVSKNKEQKINFKKTSENNNEENRKKSSLFKKQIEQLTQNLESKRKKLQSLMLLQPKVQEELRNAQNSFLEIQ